PIQPHRQFFSGKGLTASTDSCCGNRRRRRAHHDTAARQCLRVLSSVSIFHCRSPISNRLSRPVSIFATSFSGTLVTSTLARAGPTSTDRAPWSPRHKQQFCGKLWRIAGSSHVGRGRARPTPQFPLARLLPGFGFPMIKRECRARCRPGGCRKRIAVAPA
ncbi:MAG: hypothetical protein QOF09_4206, partial [Alphaproteobacteria bacterium]|nr:hypothetical protein [Alphaproteobacteria bacterium]